MMATTMKKLLQNVRKFSSTSHGNSRRSSLYSINSVPQIKILRGGYNIDLQNVDSSFTKLHRAVYLNKVERVKKYLSSSSNKNNSSSSTSSLAINVNAIDSSSRTALHLAAVNGNQNVVTMLLQAGAKVNCQDADGKTPLIKAIECCHNELVKVFMDSGADVDLADHEQGNTALHHCLLNANLECALFIIRNALVIDFKKRNHKKETYLHLAAKIPDLFIVIKELIANGIEIEARDELDRTAAQIAILHKNIDGNELINKYANAQQIQQSMATRDLLSVKNSVKHAETDQQSNELSKKFHFGETSSLPEEFTVMNNDGGTDSMNLLGNDDGRRPTANSQCSIIYDSIENLTTTTTKNNDDKLLDDDGNHGFKSAQQSDHSSRKKPQRIAVLSSLSLSSSSLSSSLSDRNNNDENDGSSVLLRNPTLQSDRSANDDLEDVLNELSDLDELLYKNLQNDFQKTVALSAKNSSDNLQKSQSIDSKSKQSPSSWLDCSGQHSQSPQSSSLAETPVEDSPKSLPVHYVNNLVVDNQRSVESVPKEKVKKDSSATSVADIDSIRLDNNKRILTEISNENCQNNSHRNVESKPCGETPSPIISPPPLASSNNDFNVSTKSWAQIAASPRRHNEPSIRNHLNIDRQSPSSSPSSSMKSNIEQQQQQQQQMNRNRKIPNQKHTNNNQLKRNQSFNNNNKKAIIRQPSNHQNNSRSINNNYSMKNQKNNTNSHQTIDRNVHSRRSLGQRNAIYWQNNNDQTRTRNNSFEKFSPSSSYSQDSSSTRSKEISRNSEQCGIDSKNSRCLSLSPPTGLKKFSKMENLMETQRFFNDIHDPVISGKNVSEEKDEVSEKEKDEEVSKNKSIMMMIRKDFGLQTDSPSTKPNGCMNFYEQKYLKLIDSLKRLIGADRFNVQLNNYRDSNQRITTNSNSSQEFEDEMAVLKCFFNLLSETNQQRADIEAKSLEINHLKRTVLNLEQQLEQAQQFNERMEIKFTQLCNNNDRFESMNDQARVMMIHNHHSNNKNNNNQQSDKNIEQFIETIDQKLNSFHQLSQQQLKSIDQDCLERSIFIEQFRYECSNLKFLLKQMVMEKLNPLHEDFSVDKSNKAKNVRKHVRRRSEQFVTKCSLSSSPSSASTASSSTNKNNDDDDEDDDIKNNNHDEQTEKRDQVPQSGRNSKKSPPLPPITTKIKKKASFSFGSKKNRKSFSLHDLTSLDQFYYLFEENNKNDLFGADGLYHGYFDDYFYTLTDGGGGGGNGSKNGSDGGGGVKQHNNANIDYSNSFSYKSKYFQMKINELRKQLDN